MKEDTRRLILEDSKDTLVVRRGQPSVDLPTLEGEIEAPKEGLWTDEQNRPVFYLGLVHLQVLEIEEAWALCSECFSRFERGTGKQFEEVIRFVRREFLPNPKANPALRRFIMHRVQRRIEERNILKLDDEYFAQSRDCILPFTDKYCCHSEAMINYLRFKWTHDILWSEVDENRPHEGFKMTRGRNQRPNVIKDSSGRLKQSYLDFMAATIPGDFVKHATLLPQPGVEKG
jgi:hypothetical protein